VQPTQLQVDRHTDSVCLSRHSMNPIRSIDIQSIYMSTESVCLSRHAMHPIRSIDIQSLYISTESVCLSRHAMHPIRYSCRSSQSIGIQRAYMLLYVTCTHMPLFGAYMLLYVRSIEVCICCYVYGVYEGPMNVGLRHNRTCSRRSELVLFTQQRKKM